MVNFKIESIERDGLHFSAANIGKVIAADVIAEFNITKKTWPSKIPIGPQLKFKIPRQPLAAPP